MAKLTLDDIQKCIVLADYYVFPGTTVTVCCLTLQHGYNVIGYSACIDNTEFDPTIGKTIALNNAIDKIWELEGYLTMFKGAKGLLPQDAVAALEIPATVPEPAAPQALNPNAPSAPAPEVTVAGGTVLPNPVVAPSEAPVDPAPAVGTTASDSTGVTVTQTRNPEPAAEPVDPTAPSSASDSPTSGATPAPEWTPFSKPATELTAEQLVVEERAEVAREKAEDSREADWKAAHPGEVPPAP